MASGHEDLKATGSFSYLVVHDGSQTHDADMDVVLLADES